MVRKYIERIREKIEAHRLSRYLKEKHGIEVDPRHLEGDTKEIKKRVEELESKGVILSSVLPAKKEEIDKIMKSSESFLKILNKVLKITPETARIPEVVEGRWTIDRNHLKEILGDKYDEKVVERLEDALNILIRTHGRENVVQKKEGGHYVKVDPVMLKNLLEALKKGKELKEEELLKAILIRKKISPEEFFTYYTRSLYNMSNLPNVVIPDPGSIKVAEGEQKIVVYTYHPGEVLHLHIDNLKDLKVRPPK